MKNYTRDYLKGVLRDYPLLSKEIEKRKEAILNPDNPRMDENTGGIRGSEVGRPVEAVAVKIADDEEINNLLNHKKAIDITLSHFSKDVQNVVKLRYFEQLCQADVSKQLGLTVAAVRVSENAFLNRLARKLKLMG
nr:hypothetical protein [uncultured Trichococcus sp.]